MKSIRVFLCAIALFSMLSSGLLAAGNGDVGIRVNGYGNAVMLCTQNMIEVRVQNDSPLYEISLGLKLNSNAGPFYVVQPWGSLPASAPILRIEGDAQGAFDMALDVDVSLLPNEIHIHGIANNNPLPAHATPTVVFSFVVFQQDGADLIEGFCVDNIVNLTTGEWSFTDENTYAPHYNGAANSSVSNPDAPPKCFYTEVYLCGYPHFTSTPPGLNQIGYCDVYTFDFDAVHLSTPPSPVYFLAFQGEIGYYTGVYTLPPDGSVGTLVDTIYVGSSCACPRTKFVLTVNRINSPPEVAICKPELRVKSGTSRIVDFDASDVDQCDTHDWSLELLSTPGPESGVTFDAQTGEISVDAATGDLDELYDYRIIAFDERGAADSCEFQLAVIDCVGGDADQNSIVNISDVVYIVLYIFGGPPPPDCEQSLDADCNGISTISDAVYLVNYIFLGGPAPC